MQQAGIDVGGGGLCEGHANDAIEGLSEFWPYRLRHRYPGVDITLQGRSFLLISLSQNK
jgi:ribosomal protein L6P/L9E